MTGWSRPGLSADLSAHPGRLMPMRRPAAPGALLPAVRQPLPSQQGSFLAPATN
jgi:hypothetical protein